MLTAPHKKVLTISMINGKTRLTNTNNKRNVENLTVANLKFAKDT